MSTKEKNFRVVDEKGNIHICDVTQILGEGGQGMVLRTLHDKNTAIKLQLTAKTPGKEELITDRLITDPEKIAGIKTDMERLRSYPLNPDLPLTMPLAALKDHVGYVMQLLDGVEDITSLMVSFSENRIDSWPLRQWMKSGSENLDEDMLRELKKLSFYMDTGGLERRLRILRDTADALAHLHAANLAYVDLQPKNVMATPAELKDEKAAWLIDVDNICHEGDLAEVSTPHYRSPEMFAGNARASAASDIYSFAILAFELLTTQHPFDGEIANEQEEIPEEGTVWIYDKNDRSNYAHRTVDTWAMTRLSPALFSLFAVTFEEGQNSPRKRPPLIFWREAFTDMLDQLARCPDCGSEWFWSNSSEICPFCDRAVPRTLTLRYNGNVLFAASMEVGQTLKMPLRLFAPSSDMPDKAALAIKYLEDGSASLLFEPDHFFCDENGEIKNRLLEPEELAMGINLKMNAPSAWPVQLRMERNRDEE